MARVKRGVVSHARHKKVLKAAKGFYGRRKNTIRTARSAVEKSLLYSYRDRKARKRTFRALWIQRINAAVRSADVGLTYSSFMDGLIKANIELDRKMLANIALKHSEEFGRLISLAKGSSSLSQMAGDAGETDEQASPAPADAGETDEQALPAPADAGEIDEQASLAPADAGEIDEQASLTPADAGAR